MSGALEASSLGAQNTRLISTRGKTDELIPSDTKS
jgi:hypothetical protein